MSHFNTFSLVPTNCFTANQLTVLKKEQEFIANSKL